MSGIKRSNIVKLNRQAEPAEMREPSIEMIRERAYQLFIARGATDGGDVTDWFRAERELRATSRR